MLMAFGDTDAAGRKEAGQPPFGAAPPANLSPFLGRQHHLGRDWRSIGHVVLATPAGLGDREDQADIGRIGERRSTGEQKYYISNLPADATLKTLAAAIKARWICEQAHQQLKEELGLDHLEGRFWIGLHRHALMTMIAYAFLKSRRLKAAGRKKRVWGKLGRKIAPGIGPRRAGGSRMRTTGPGFKVEDRPHQTPFSRPQAGAGI